MANGLQCMIDVLNMDVNVTFCSILKKSVCVAYGFKPDSKIHSKMTVMSIVDNEILKVSELKFLNVHFKAARALDVNITPIKPKFYGAFNSLMPRCKHAVEPVKFQLLK
jgi:hypothetical protein